MVSIVTMKVFKSVQFWSENMTVIRDIKVVIILLYQNRFTPYLAICQVFQRRLYELAIQILRSSNIPGILFFIHVEICIQVNIEHCALTFGLFQPQPVLSGTPVCRQWQLRVKIQCFQLSLINTCRPYLQVESNNTRDFAAQSSLFNYSNINTSEMFTMFRMLSDLQNTHNQSLA